MKNLRVPEPKNGNARTIGPGLPPTWLQSLMLQFQMSRRSWSDRNAGALRLGLAQVTASTANA